MPVTTTMLVRTGQPHAGAAPLVGPAGRPTGASGEHRRDEQQREVVVLDLAAARPAAVEHEQAAPTRRGTCRAPASRAIASAAPTHADDLEADEHRRATASGRATTRNHTGRNSAAGWPARSA